MQLQYGTQSCQFGKTHIAILPQGVAALAFGEDRRQFAAQLQQWWPEEDHSCK